MCSNNSPRSSSLLPLLVSVRLAARLRLGKAFDRYREPWGDVDAGIFRVGAYGKHFKGFQQVGPQNPGDPEKYKKRKSIEKSYLNVFYGSKNVLNRFSMFELLLLVPKNIIQLHLSFEIGAFEVGVSDFY